METTREQAHWLSLSRALGHRSRDGRAWRDGALSRTPPSSIAALRESRPAAAGSPYPLFPSRDSRVRDDFLSTSCPGRVSLYTGHPNTGSAVAFSPGESLLLRDILCAECPCVCVRAAVPAGLSYLAPSPRTPDQLHLLAARSHVPDRCVLRRPILPVLPGPPIVLPPYAPAMPRR